MLRPRPNDYKETLELMWDAFFPHEPVIACLGLAQKRNPVLEETVLQCLAEGVSVIAKCKYTGKIVGGCLNESSVPWDPDIKERIACSASCVELRHLFHFWAFLQRAPKLWEKFDVQKVLEVSFLSYCRIFNMNCSGASRKMRELSVRICRLGRKKAKALLVDF